MCANEHQWRCNRTPISAPEAHMGSGQPKRAAVVTAAFDQQIGGDHYLNFNIQPIEFIERNRLGFSAGNIIKYLCRYKSKGGIEDLEKARHYLDLLIELETDDAHGS